MLRGYSLASKFLLLFGGAALLIVSAALFLPWLRMTALIDQGQLEVSRVMVTTWERLAARPPQDDMGPRVRPWVIPRLGPGLPDAEERGGIIARRLSLRDARELAREDDFLRDTLDRFDEDPTLSDAQQASWDGTSRAYRYARADRTLREGRLQLDGVVLLERSPVEATRLVLFNSLYLLAAGSAVLTFALLVFYLITRKLVLEPVKALESTAERVRRGNLATRADLSTGDEFQQLAEAFNSMLNDLQSSQDRLRGINAALDVKLHELAEANNALYQAAKIKGEFLANVSHELRTPLNSIIGFAELLLENARAEAEQPDPAPQVLRRVRYLDNIVTAGRNLLALINSLLDMAKIEAGKIELHVERMNLKDACEALINLIHPLADKRGIQLRLEVSDDLPALRTDPKKFQQVIFNFLSNAVKFTEPAERTGRPGVVTLRAERLMGAMPGLESSQVHDRIRVSVIDNGPGIPKDEQARVFEKFYQLDGGHTREHAGTGLGLAICKELAQILQAEIQVESEVGRGSMFSLILPLEIDPAHAPEAAMEARFRSALVAGRAL
jgi:signal transduction histidine kinase